MRDKHQDIKGSHELLFVLVALLREKKNKFHTRIDRNDFTKARSHQEMGFTPPPVQSVVVVCIRNLNLEIIGDPFN